MRTFTAQPHAAVSAGASAFQNVDFKTDGAWTDLLSGLGLDIGTAVEFAKGIAFDSQISIPSSTAIPEASILGSLADFISSANKSDTTVKRLARLAKAMTASGLTRRALRKKGLSHEDAALLSLTCSRTYDFSAISDEDAIKLVADVRSNIRQFPERVQGDRKSVV